MDTKEMIEKVNGFVAKLPFIGLAEKIPASAREKAPVLNRAIPWANHIACVLIAVVLIGGISSCGGGKYNPDRLLKMALKESGMTMAEYRKMLAEEGITDKEAKDMLVAAAKEADGISDGASAQKKAVKAAGKNYTLSKETDFKYDLTQIDGTDYVVIKDLNVPANFQKPEDNGKIIHDTLTLKVPEKIEGYTVGAIECLGYRESITSVTLPDTILEIRDSAFSVSSGLTSIKFPKNLKKIGESAFSRTGIGGALTFPAGVTEIGGYAFRGTNITSVTIPAGVTRIESYTFHTCESLKEVTIPDSVTFIERGAFYGCKELSSVKLPSHPIEYGSDAFSGCPKLSLAVRKTITDTGYTGKF